MVFAATVNFLFMDLGLILLLLSEHLSLKQILSDVNLRNTTQTETGLNNIQKSKSNIIKIKFPLGLYISVLNIPFP